MKTVTIKNYIQGLSSFLDDNDIAWEDLGEEGIKIYYKNEESLFRLAFDFGKFYSTN